MAGFSSQVTPVNAGGSATRTLPRGAAVQATSAPQAPGASGLIEKDILPCVIVNDQNLSGGQQQGGKAAQANW